MPPAPADALAAGDMVRLLAALAVLLLGARVLGELARRLGQAPVLGEILAGIALGPTVLGRAAPGAFEWLFPGAGPVALVLVAVAGVALVWFMFAAGLEVDLSAVRRQGRAVAWVSLAGLVVPFAAGFAAASVAPDLLGREAGAAASAFPLVLGTALCISALPVIARTLADLDLARTDFGALVLAAATLDDLLGWIVFASLLALVERGGGALPAAAGLSPGLVLLAVLVYAVLVLTLGRWLLDRALPRLTALSGPAAGGLSLGLTLALAGAALTEALGVHAVFGAFLVGVALGDSRHLGERTRGTIAQFVGGGLAPLFFASIGLRTDFAAAFDPGLCALLFVLACAGKLGGGLLGARLAGLPRREALATGVALNARGAMEIVLGLVALRAGFVGERLYVALVVVALVTSLMGPPLLRSLLRRPGG
jgi:Kef-type K+ transport system membrane component KefB